jgi:hypothetical protein
MVSDATATGSVDQLVGITSIDGNPVDMTVVLDASPAQLQTRLETLKLIIAAGRPDFDGATLRDQARDIVSKPPFSAGVVSNNGILSRIVRFIGDLFSSTSAQGLGLAVIVAVALVIGYLVLDRTVAHKQAVASAAHPTPPSVDYRAEADAAAAGGDFAGAVRLLFQDGARHLEQLDVVLDAATTSTATVRPLTNERHFLDRFDAIAYGGAKAQGDDVAEARRSWDALTNRLESR